MSVRSHDPTEDRLDAKLHRLDELDKSLSKRDKRIVRALRRFARAIDTRQRNKTA